MKIGILTFHFARNYGAVLQCFALQQKLKGMGHDVYVIDYRPEAVAKGYRWFDIRRFLARTPALCFRRAAREFSVIGSRKARFSSFEKFIGEHFNLVAPGSMTFDLVICGSDQIWNTRITGGFDRMYWGTEPAEWSKALISYAASIEDGEMDRETVAKLLRQFDGVSVREPSAASRLGKLGIDATICCDPVMLAGKDTWTAIASRSSLRLSNFLLLYQVRYSDELYAMAKTLAEEKGLKLVVLSAKVEMMNSKEVASASPADFVRLLTDADFVVTSSFHGVALCLMLGKQFKTMNMGDGRDGRISDLLEIARKGELPGLIDSSNAYLNGYLI